MGLIIPGAPMAGMVRPGGGIELNPEAGDDFPGADMAAMGPVETASMAWIFAVAAAAATAAAVGIVLFVGAAVGCVMVLGGVMACENMQHRPFNGTKSVAKWNEEVYGNVPFQLSGTGLLNQIDSWMRWHRSRLELSHIR